MNCKKSGKELPMNLKGILGLRDHPRFFRMHGGKKLYGSYPVVSLLFFPGLKFGPELAIFGYYSGILNCDHLCHFPFLTPP